MLKFYINKAIRKLFMGAAVKNSIVDKTARIGIMSNVANCTIGKYSYLGDSTTITNAEIGNFTSISSNCVIGGGEHPMNWVSTSPVFTSHRSILNFNFAKHNYNPHKKTVIGNDVWIGTHCLIKSGIHIGDGAVIGMGSVVTKDVGDYEIWAGNPARLIKKRFEEPMLSDLRETKWWQLDDDKISDYADYFNDSEEFLKRMEAGK